MREMFDAIDADRNGFVDAEELKSTFASLGVPLSNSDVKQMLKEANIQGTRIFYEGMRADLEEHLSSTE
jgi:Ca2+-binding EF-hand superfamily protein